jgi:arginine-tRNA-protein transferase
LNRFNKHIVGDAYAKEAARLFPKSREEIKKRNTEFDLLERVHECEKAHLRAPPDPARALVVTLESDIFTEEKYLLFENYQRIVHHEPPHRISRHGFKNFLCSSPLPRSKETFDGRERRLGSYHQCYRLDGMLVAIGVLDLLPQCVSAVYFMYHESVHEHAFGKLGALREIALAKEEGYRWWYAGFYIHGCIKMRYKGDYTPQFILDPETYCWDILDSEAKKILDAKKFVSLSLERAEPQSTKDSVEIAPEAENVEMIDGDSDDERPVPFPDISLGARTMPGILTKAQLLADVDLDHISLRIGGQEAHTCDLMRWETMDMDNPHSIKGMIADLAAAVGAELAMEMVVIFD